MASACKGLNAPSSIFTVTNSMEPAKIVRLISIGAPIPPIVANMIVVPLVLLYAYGIRPLWFSFLTVTIGEVIPAKIVRLISIGYQKLNPDTFI